MISITHICWSYELATFCSMSKYHPMFVLATDVVIIYTHVARDGLGVSSNQYGALWHFANLANPTVIGPYAVWISVSCLTNSWFTQWNYEISSFGVQNSLEENNICLHSLPFQTSRCCSQRKQFLMEATSTSTLHVDGQYHGSWWPGNARRQGISRYGIDHVGKIMNTMN